MIQRTSTRKCFDKVESFLETSPLSILLHSQGKPNEKTSVFQVSQARSQGKKKEVYLFISVMVNVSRVPFLLYPS